MVFIVILLCYNKFRDPSGKMHAPYDIQGWERSNPGFLAQTIFVKSPSHSYGSNVVWSTREFLYRNLYLFLKPVVFPYLYFIFFVSLMLMNLVLMLVAI